MHEKGRNPWQVPLHHGGSATKGTQNVAGIPLLDVDWVDLSLYGTRENKVAIYSQTIDILHVALEAKLSEIGEALLGKGASHGSPI